jgi:hypothetical protein
MNALALGIGGALVGGVASGLINGVLGGSANYRLFSNKNFSIAIPCSIRERHSDVLTITDHPVEIGSKISDHAYLNPQRVDIEIVYGSGQIDSLVDIYQKFTSLQASRELFNIVTGKRSYRDMLIEVIECTTDARTENLLRLNLHCRQVIIVSTQIVQADSKDQANAKDTAAPTQKGTAQTFPLKDQSAIKSVPL